MRPAVPSNFWNYWQQAVAKFDRKTKDRAKGELLESIARYYLQHYSSSRQEYVAFGREGKFNRQIDQRVYQLWSKGKSQQDMRGRGIDIACKRSDHTYDLVQSKAWESKNSINDRDLSSFFHAVLELKRKGLKINSLIVVNLSKSGEFKNIESELYQEVQQQGLEINENITAAQLNHIDFEAFDRNRQPHYDPPPPIREYQALAVQKTISHFRHHDKGKLIMASGTGKTFTAWHIIKRFVATSKLNSHPTNIIFFCPSLNLLDQTAKNFITWRDGAREINVNFLAVCSWKRLGDRTAEYSHYVLTYNDSAVLTEKVNSYHQQHQHDTVNIVFATYHSIQIIIDAQVEHGLAPFDLVICDEAHHTVGSRERERERERAKITAQL